jgi:hypothetical protein
VLNIRELVQKPLFDQSSIKLSYSKYLTAVDGAQPEIAENVREINQDDPVMQFPLKEVVQVS